MNLVLTNPWGLLALASVPAILALHLFVLRGKRRQVSCLALWGAPDQLGHEGRTRQRPPITVPLILELCTAVVLSLLLAGLEVVGASKSERVVGVVVDGSASMAGGTALAEARQHIAQIDPSMRVALFVTTPEPRRLGEPAMTPAMAAAALESFTPNAPHHSLAPAVELLARTGFAPEQTLIFSDAPDIDDDRIARVGQPVDNVGIVNGSWESGVPIVAVVQRFGDEPATTRLHVTFEDGSHDSVKVDFRHDAIATVRVRPPASTVARVTLSLPTDGLAADNELILLRPANRGVALRLEHPAPGVRRAVRRAITAIPSLSMATREGDIVVTDGSSRAPFGIEVAILIPEKSELLSHQPLVAEPGSPLTRGIDPRGLVWSGDPNPTAGLPLLMAGKVPLIWLDDDRIVIQVDPRRSNLLSHSTFPILFDNITESLQQGRARSRRSFRLGERLTVHRPDSCGGAATLAAPSGAEIEFPADQTVLDAGALLELGVFALDCDGRTLQRVSVGLLDAREGDLAARTPDGILPRVSARPRRAGGNVIEPRQVLAAAAGILILAAWLWLSRREVSP